MRLEYSILLERLEGRVYNYSSGGDENDLILGVGSPVLLDETLNLRLTKLGNTKDKQSNDKSEKSDKSSKTGNKKAVKDPNLPKRPSSAYVLFCELERERLRAEFEALNPGKPATEFTKYLVELWKNLDPVSKAPFNKAHEDDKERYAREMQEYNERKVAEQELKSLNSDVTENLAEKVENSLENEAEGGAELMDAESRPDINIESMGSRSEKDGQKENDGNGETAENGGIGGIESGTAPIKEETSNNVAPSSSIESDQPLAKKQKIETTRTVAGGSNGHPRITIKLRSPTAPQP